MSERQIGPGAMQGQGRNDLATAWWMGVPAGAVIFLTLSISPAGDRPRDKLDPALQIARQRSAGPLGARRGAEARLRSDHRPRSVIEMANKAAKGAHHAKHCRTVVNSL